MTPARDDHPRPYRTIIERPSLSSHLDTITRADELDPKLVAIIGEGGSGKTETVRRLLARLKATDAIVAKRMVDLYHTYTHTDEGFMAEVVEVLDDDSGNRFLNYQQERARLDHILLAGEVDKIAGQRKTLHNSFITDLTALADNQRVVVACDTAEKLVYSPPKPSQNDSHDHESDKEVQPIWSSLITHVARIPNVLIIVAGRKEIRELLDHGSTPDYKLITIDPFTIEETEQLLKQLKTEAEARKDDNASQRLSAIAPYLERIHEISQGRPIYLSLMIDQLSMGSFPSIFDPNFELTHDISEAEEKFERYFVKKLMEAGDYWSDVVIALGRLKKGATAELVAELVAPNEEIADVARAENQLDAFKEYAFIKVRPADERIFLHDQLYELLDKYLYSLSGEKTKGVAARKKLDQHYENQLDKLRTKLDESYAPLEDRFTPIEELEEKRAELAELHAERRELLAEVLYYKLRWDQERGFLRYYRYMREAILSNDTELDRLLQVELATFLDEKPNISPKLRNTIDALLLIRNVVRAWSEGDYDKAIKLAVNLQKKSADYFEPDLKNSSAAILYTWEAYARILRSKNDGEDSDLVEAERLLSEAIDWLLELQERETNEEYAVAWRRRAVLAFAYRVRGYLRWASHYMKGSEEDLKAALLLWREINLKAEMATTLNDLGFTQAEQANIQSGIRHVREALKLRKFLTNRSPVALSYNTLGIIRLMEGNYDTAIAQSTVALRLGRALDNRRVQCLALTSLAEAHRRKANSSHTQLPEQKWNLLIQAHCLIEEAVKLAQQIDEPLRNIEALIEAGCVSRDMAQLLSVHRGGELALRQEDFDIDQALSNCDPHKTVRALLGYQDGVYPQLEELLRTLFNKSNEILLTAQVTADESYQALALDAAVNRAWLHFYAQRSEDELVRAIESAKALVPLGYEYKDFRAPSMGGPAADRGIWRQLGKLSMLEGVSVYNKVRQSDEKSFSTEQNVMVNNWLKSLQYSTLAGGPEHRDVKRAAAMLYGYMADMGVARLRFITREVKRIKRRYSMNEEPAIELFMKESGFWYP